MLSKEAALRELRTIPGVGKRISEYFWELGLRTISDLKGKNPEKLYATILR